MKTLLLLSPLEVEPEKYYLDHDKLINGNPLQTLWMHYTDESAQFFAGIWQSEPGKWRIHYTEEEYCCISAGVSVVTDEAGNSTSLKPGDEFIIPKGFVGTWEVIETTTKRFVIYEKNA